MGSARAPLLSPMMRVFTRLFSLVIGQVDTDVLHRPGSPTGLPLLVWRTTKVDFKQSACIDRCNAIVCIQLHCTSRRIRFAMRTFGRRTGDGCRSAACWSWKFDSGGQRGCRPCACHISEIFRVICARRRHLCQERSFAPGCPSAHVRGMHLASPPGAEPRTRVPNCLSFRLGCGQRIRSAGANPPFILP
jgi:hypothetical protein